MSKMPAKKKSCFQITSVTTAAAAPGAAEDTESLDDPDESRTEDVSSEILDASRASDDGPEAACARSSSEETLSQAGEAETPAAPGAPGPPGPAAACGSRFRVIKLDHGSGEPFRRGRWTCVEFYEREAEGGAPARPADGLRPAGAAEPPAERDSGLGATAGSGPGADGGAAGPAEPGAAAGARGAPCSLPPADAARFHTRPPAGPADDARRKSEPLPQPPPAPPAEGAADAPPRAPGSSLAGPELGLAGPADGDEDRNPSTAFYQAFHLNTFQESKSLWDSASGGGVVAIDNKIEQAMDLVKSHLMYAVREEVEVLKEQIKELVERNSLLERENALLKSLSNNDQLSQLPAQQANPGSTSQPPAATAQPPQPVQPNVSSA
ncbi:TSC22 domain family protein 2-like [Dipodomys merriami]|uniref:TSC22 domain family protein 2-like n=1 Tax=Dipodomys merriami TaxID=94247 RepID=UPI0038556F1D